ncbi:NADPH-dependent ferric siderophore reductase [Tamaricihabitans halophyticus]|uniref:NADPH-dependent ferric siderophore reductase n=1 Tax=Tamaricihabitans halophyticus TaxID=1262583 RepID=A0A4R2QL55_9PSEU|nr:siderophore-interacting protein [Tamaricihabitans halophyticus]TCP49258.1 NADPH-dependent ferric siderophore reductase [Tamaricihabitans halophyticus]
MADADSTSVDTATRNQYKYQVVRVTTVRRLSPHMTRITFSSPELREFPASLPDQSIKLFFPLAHQSVPEVPELTDDDVLSWYKRYLAMPDEIRPSMRTYTVRYHRPAVGELDVDFVLHGDTGPASRFALAAQPGQRIGLLGPSGLYQPPRDCGWQLIAGDETALPAIGAIVESLGPEAKALVYVEIGDERDRQWFDTAGDVQVTWVNRGTEPAGHSDRLVNAIRAARFPGGTPYLWLSGEAGMVKSLRRHLVNERGIDKRLISFTGYWRVGRSEEQTARENVAAASNGVS